MRINDYMTKRRIETAQKTAEYNELREYTAETESTLMNVYAEAVATVETADTDPRPTAGVLIGGVTEEWTPGNTYDKGQLLRYNNAIAYVKQPKLTAQEIYPPFSVGTEALYGARPAPNPDGTYPYIYNMAASVGMKVWDDGVLYECYNPIDGMYYPPSQLAAHFRLAE